jgi:hypothetical protein
MFESDQVSPRRRAMSGSSGSPRPTCRVPSRSARTTCEHSGVAYRWNGTGWHNAGLPRVLTDSPGVSVLSPANVWIGWNSTTKSHAMRWDGQHWHTMTIPDDVIANTSNVVPDGQGGYWFGGAAILTGSTWTSEPIIQATGPSAPWSASRAPNPSCSPPVRRTPTPPPSSQRSADSTGR